MSWSSWVNINIFLNFANYRGDFWGQVAVFQSTLVNSWHSRPSSSRPSEQSISVCPIAFVKIFIYSSKLAILSNSTTWKSFLISKRDSSGIIYNLSYHWKHDTFISKGFAFGSVLDSSTDIAYNFEQSACDFPIFNTETMTAASVLQATTADCKLFVTGIVS